MMEKIEKLEARKVGLTDLLTNTDDSPPLLHPNMAEIFHRKIVALYAELQCDEIRARAAETFRSPVERIGGAGGLAANESDIRHRPSLWRTRTFSE